MDRDVDRFVALTLIMLVTPSSAMADCRLCAPSQTSTQAAARPIEVVIDTALDFSRAGQKGAGGSIDMSPRSGGRHVAGLADLGGVALAGRVTITGEPFRSIRVSLPGMIRLFAPDGSSADAVELISDLPPDPVLDASGRLSFAFGGRLIVAPGVSGELRGRIPVTADYR